MKTLSDFYRLFPSRPASIAHAPARLMAIAARVPVAEVAPVAATAPANDSSDTDNAPRYRTRDYGTGYGRSSGYALDRSYTAGFGDRMLRVG